MLLYVNNNLWRAFREFQNTRYKQILNYAVIILNYNEIEKVQQLARHLGLNQQASCELNAEFTIRSTNY